MTTSPAHDHQPRDTRGRFGAFVRAEDEPNLVIVQDLDGQPVTPGGIEVVWPDIDTHPAEAQDLLHGICWDSDVDDRTRVLAARGAIAMSVDQHGSFQGLPPDEEAHDAFREAVADNDLILDAVHDLGPFEHPQTQEFGTRLTGAIYDLAEARRQERLALTERVEARGYIDAEDTEALWAARIADAPRDR